MIFRRLWKRVGQTSRRYCLLPGSRLDANLARTLHQAGLSAAFVSLDHFSVDQHDRIRCRSGAFAMAIEAIRACLEVGIYTAVQAVVEPSLLQPGVLEQFLDYCNDLGVHEIMLLEAVAIGADRVAITLDETGHNRLADLHRQAVSDVSRCQRYRAWHGSKAPTVSAARRALLFYTLPRKVRHFRAISCQRRSATSSSWALPRCNVGWCDS